MTYPEPYKTASIYYKKLEEVYSAKIDKNNYSSILIKKQKEKKAKFFSLNYIKQKKDKITFVVRFKN